MGELTKYFIEIIPKIDTELKYYSLLLSVFLVAAYVFLRSDFFHKTWARVVEVSLNSSQTFRIVRLAIVISSVVVVLFTVLAFSAPLILKKIEGETRIGILDAVTRHKSTDVSDLESADFRDKFKQAWLIFKDARDYTAARQAFEKLHDLANEELSRESLAGLITATFYVQDRHIEGLDFICGQYKSKAPNDSRYRYQIHAHARKLALAKGMAYVDRLMRKYAEECKRSDFTPVWAAVARGKIEYLMSHVTNIEESYYLDENEKQFLKDLILEGEVGYLDHAHYFLLQFNQVIESYPDSYIRDMALLASAQIAKSGPDSIKFYSKYLEEYQNGPRQVFALHRLYRNYLSVGNFKRATELIDKLPMFEIQDFEGHWERNLDNGEAYYSRGNFRKALETYKEQKQALEEKGYPIPQRLEQKSRELEKVIAKAQDRSETALWQLALFFREEAGTYYNRIGRHGNAIQILEELVDTWPKSELAPKALYLIMSSYKKLHKYKMAFNAASRLATLYPKSQLADDAYAEMGWYALNVEENHSQALEYFEICKTNYDGWNAADNCLYHMGLAAYQLGKYQTALEAFAKISKDYAEARLAQYVSDNYEMALLASKGMQKSIPGLVLAESWGRVYVEDVISGSQAAEIGFKRLDRILEIGGTAVYSISGYHRALGRQGHEISMVFSRNQEKYTYRYKYH